MGEAAHSRYKAWGFAFEACKLWVSPPPARFPLMSHELESKLSKEGLYRVSPTPANCLKEGYIGDYLAEWYRGYYTKGDGVWTIAHDT